MASWKEKYESAVKRAGNLKKKGTQALGYMLEAAEVGGTATVLGYARGRMSDPTKEGDELTLAGVPVELWVAGGMGLTGAAGLFGKYSEHAVHIGSGALAAFGTLQGLTMGIKARVDQGKAALNVQTKRRRMAQGGSVGASHMGSGARSRAQ